MSLTQASTCHHAATRHHVNGGPTMADQLRLGVVGANPNIGWASRTHMPGLMALSEYEIEAVCTTKQESAEAAAQKYEAGKAYWDFRKLVADPDVDVVDVCVRVPYHH